MTLDQQIQALIDGAPDIESRTSIQAIAPSLHRFATTLPQSEYYVCQSPQGDWVLTTLQHRQQHLQIRVIYAFSQIQDIGKVDRGLLQLGSAVKMPIVQLLFELLATPEIDRIVFLNNSHQLDRGQEITRQELEQAIVQELQPAIPQQQNPNLPPDIC